MTIKRKHLLAAAVIVFIAFEAVMFCMIHFIKPQSSFDFRYASIIAATLFAWVTLAIDLITAKSENKNLKEIVTNLTDGNLIRIAMLFTLVADYFMVALAEPNNLAGVTVFLGTQLFIFLHIYLNDKDKRVRLINLILRPSLTAVFVLVAIIILGSDTDAMAIISVIYYANLCINAAFAHRIEGRKGIMLTIGLILFALCDINVGLSALDSIYGGFEEGTLLFNLMNSDVDLIWIFYIPSQTLIPLTLVLSDAKTEVNQ